MSAGRWDENDLAIARRKQSRTQPLPMLEKELQSAVIQLATLKGWRHYHPWNSEHSVSGYPDLTLVKPPRLLFVELKSEKGIVSPAQQIWLETLSKVPGVEALIWRPADWLSGEIDQVLSAAAQ